MQGHNTSEVLRRSSRVPIAVPLLVTSLDPGNDFSEVCETLVVSAHGCAIRSPMKVKTGIPVHFHTKDGRQMMAQIVDCQPIGSTPQSWKLGAQLEQPDNWGLNPCPEDWVQAREQRQSKSKDQVPAASASFRSSQPASARTTAEADREMSVSDLRTIVGPLLQPLQEEIAALQDKLSRREANHSRFEVSLSQIPPELEKELWVRLRQDLGQRALQLTREESERVLSAAQGAIERQITKSQNELQQYAATELKAVEQRAQELTNGIGERVQRHLRAALERFEQRVSEAEARVAQQGEETLAALRQQLEEERRAQREEMQHVRDSVLEDWSRIQAQLANINGRLAKLDESARHLEADFDAHVAAVAGNLASKTKEELESTADALLDQIRTHNAQELEMQLDAACGQLGETQKALAESLSESLQARVSQAEQGLEHTMNDLAQQCVGRWRLALARQLNSFASALGQQLRVDLAPNEPGRD